MLAVRRVATGIVVAAALAVLILSVYLLVDARQWDYPPTNTSFASDLDSRAQIFQEKLDMYSRRINDMEMMIVILLGITGLYTIMFILTSDFNARAVGRQVDRAMSGVKDQIGRSLAELRGLKDETRDVVRAEVREAAKRLDHHAHELVQRVRGEGAIPLTAEVVRDLTTIDQRIVAIADTRASEDQAQEVLHYEGVLPVLELLHARQLGPQLAQIYRGLARYYRQRDLARTRFYLNRAAALAPDDFETANELGFLALEGRLSPDYRLARRHFEASLAAEPDQQRAQYGLALIAKAEGDLETAQGLLEGALDSENWEADPDARKVALVHYALACVLARRGVDAPQGYRAQYLIRATQQLQEAFASPSRQLEQMLSRDTEDGGDLAVLANTAPYGNAVDDLLLKVSVGAA